MSEFGYMAAWFSIEWQSKQLRGHCMAEKKARENLAAHDDLNQPDDRKRAVYAALESKDTRFDGQIFAGVSSTDTY